MFYYFIRNHDLPSEIVRISVLRFRKRLVTYIKAEGGHFAHSLN